MMKITSIPQIYRNLNRAIEVFSVLSKYGLANWISKLGVDFAKDFLKSPDGLALARHSPEVRIRLALTELGPTFIKLGQVLSTRADIVGVKLAEELERLQADVPADKPADVRTMIEAELGRPVEELFAEFEDEAMASASIGQCHRARLASGEQVVVKVQHHKIEKKVQIDLDILSGLAQLAERVPEFKNYRPTATFDEFRRTMLRELDFNRERRNMERFTRMFAGDRHVRIPRGYPELCTARVLTMEYVEGVKVTEAAAHPEEFDLELLARRGAEVYLEMIFTHGVYHADPHPGNIVLLEDNVIGLLDFGMVGQLDEQLREDVEEMLFAIVNQDATHLTSIITRVGAVPLDLDQGNLSVDVADYVSHYAAQPLAEFNLAAAINELTEIVRRYEIMLPARVAMLLKVLVMLEGTARIASPTFNLTEIIRPYQRKVMLRRLSPARQIKKLRRIYSELEHLAEALPRGILDILQQVRSGKFDVHLDHRGLMPSVNRLVVGLLSSALFLGSSIMLASEVPPLINLPRLGIQNLSALGAAGAVVGLGLGLRLLWAVRKSGHLD